MVCVEFPTEVDSGKVSLWVPSASRQAPASRQDKGCLDVVGSILQIHLHLWSTGQGHWEWLWEVSWRLPPLWASSHHFSRTGLQLGLLLSACWYSQSLAMIPVKDIFRVQAGCQAYGQDLDCSTEQGAERQPGLMSDQDVTTRAARQRQEASVGICGRQCHLCHLCHLRPWKGAELVSLCSQSS